MMNQSKLSVPRLTKVALSMMTMSFLLSGCGSAFSPSSPITCGANCSNNANGSNGTTTTPGAGSGADGSSATEAWKNLNVRGSVSEGWAKDTLAVEIDKANKELIIRLPMLATPYLVVGMPDIQIPQLPGARLSLESIANDRVALALRVPLSQYLQGISFAPPSRLPNGDLLPGVPDGEMPSVAVQLNKARDIKATIYLSPSVVGIYVNTPINPYIDLTVPIRSEVRQILGYFSTVSAKNGFEGGFFISVKLPSDVVRIIDDVI